MEVYLLNSKTMSTTSNTTQSTMYSAFKEYFESIKSLTGNYVYGLLFSGNYKGSFGGTLYCTSTAIRFTSANESYFLCGVYNKVNDTLILQSTNLNKITS